MRVPTSAASCLIPPIFRSTSVVMRDDVRDQSRVSRWALPASLVVHLMIVALLIFGLPVSLLQPQKEEAIAVALVPPPKPPAKANAEPPPPAQETKAAKPQEAKVE